MVFPRRQDIVEQLDTDPRRRLTHEEAARRLGRDKVPADVRLLTVKGLHVNEAILTGESGRNR